MSNRKKTYDPDFEANPEFELMSKTVHDYLLL